MMGTPEKPIQLKLFVDKKKKKVMYAEAAEDFVDILCSFFTLPLGTIAKLLKKHADSKDVKVGSLLSLYESVVSLDQKHFSEKYLCEKDYLVNPINSSASICNELKVNLDDTKPTSFSVLGYEGYPVLLKSLANFIITEDLNVVPAMLDTNIVLFNSLGIENINLLEEKIMDFGLEEFLNLLKWSLLSNNPLTNMVFGGGKPQSSSVSDSTLSNSALILSKYSGKTPTSMKLLVQKSNKKLLCAQVDNLFVELLCSFLTIPLGTVIRLTKDDGLSPLGVTNLYNSISCLGDGKYLKSDDVKFKLLFPKLAPLYLRVTDFLPIYEANKPAGRFLLEKGHFILYNDLEVTASPLAATFSKFNALGVPVGDMEVLEVTFGKHEALLLLKASLTSTSALTDFLNASSLNKSRKKPKVESST